MEDLQKKKKKNKQKTCKEKIEVITTIKLNRKLRQELTYDLEKNKQKMNESINRKHAEE